MPGTVLEPYRAAVGRPVESTAMRMASHDGVVVSGAYDPGVGRKSGSPTSHRFVHLVEGGHVPKTEFVEGLPEPDHVVVSVAEPGNDDGPMAVECGKGR